MIQGWLTSGDRMACIFSEGANCHHWCVTSAEDEKCKERGVCWKRKIHPGQRLMSKEEREEGILGDRSQTKYPIE